MSPLTNYFQRCSMRHPNCSNLHQSFQRVATDTTHRRCFISSPLPQSQQFFSPFLITAISHRMTHPHSSNIRSQNTTHNLVNRQMKYFSMRPSNLSQSKSASRPQTAPSPDTSTASVRTKGSLTDEQEEGKAVTKKSNWAKVKQYGKTGVAVYCSLWFGMFGMYFAAIHGKVIDIVTIAELIPYGQERINHALSSKWAESAVAVALTEISEIIRLPLTLFVTPSLAKYFEPKDKK